ncbi:MAG: transcriptional repressor LexA [Candidatus Paceibacterota bacterium]
MEIEKIKNKIASFYEKHRRLPAYSEIMELTGLKSKNSVFRLVKKLIHAGFMEKDRAGKLIPDKIYGQIKILGQVQAGFPSPAEEELVDTISLDEYLIKNREATFMLKVSGDSMVDAGIMEGDMVLADRSATPRAGDIVIAEIDSEWTMKYLRKTGGQMWLQAANKKYKPIYPEQELKIAAVVKAVIRKY